jgi:hypothetical protein
MVQVTTEGLRPTETTDASADVGQWAIAGGTPDVIEVAYPTQVEALVDGMCLRFRASGTTTSTTPTFSPDQLTEKTIVKNSGALDVGDIVLDGEYIVTLNLVNDVWTLLNPGTL